MTIQTSVDFIDACDLLKCHLARMLALVTASQQRACRLYERDMYDAMLALKDIYRAWRETGGQA